MRYKREFLFGILFFYAKKSKLKADKSHDKEPD